MDYEQHGMNVEDFDDFVFQVSDGRKMGDIVIDLEKVKVPFIIDSGASINVIDSNTYKNIVSQNPSLQLNKTASTVSAYGNRVTRNERYFF